MSSSLHPEGPRKELSGIKRELDQLLTELTDLNSAFPATQRFLDAKGLSHLSELDREGLKELRAHLEAIYRQGHPGH